MCRSVLHPGARRHEHLPAGQARTPREVDRIAVQSVVVQTEPLPHLFGDEHRAAVDREDLEHAIELALIDLPGLQRRHRVPEAIDRTPDVAQGAWVLQVHDLRADDADTLRSLQPGRFDKVGDGVGVEHRVAVQEQDVVGRSGHRQGQRDAERSGIPERVFVADHPLRTEGPDEEVMGLVGRRIVDREDAEGGVGLRRERVETFAEGGVRCAHDEDAEDRRVVRRCVVAL